MAKTPEFFKNELWRVTTVHDVKSKKRKVENLSKGENKCIQKDFLIPIYKIFLPKISAFNRQ